MASWLTFGRTKIVRTVRSSHCLQFFELQTLRNCWKGAQPNFRFQRSRPKGFEPQEVLSKTAMYWISLNRDSLSELSNSSIEVERADEHTSQPIAD